MRITRYKRTGELTRSSELRIKDIIKQLNEAEKSQVKKWRDEL